MNKRIVSLLIAIAMVLCLVACSKQPTDVADPDDPSNVQESDLNDQNGEEGSSTDGPVQTNPFTQDGSESTDAPSGNVGEDTQSQDTPVSNDGSAGTAGDGNTNSNTGSGTSGNGGSSGNGVGNTSSSEGSEGNVDSGSGTVTTVPEKTEDCTYAEYHAMTPEAQQQFFAKFESVEAFFVWYNAAKAQHEKDNAAIEIGDGEIDLGEVIGSGK